MFGQERMYTAALASSEFLGYFYQAAMVYIALKLYEEAEHYLLVILNTAGGTQSLQVFVSLRAHESLIDRYDTSRSIFYLH